MSLRSWLSSFKFPAVLAMAALGAGCSNYHYKGYQGDWQPELMVPYDLSKGAADAPVVYFATTRYRALGVKFHRLLLATHVDGELLEGAGRRSILDISGEQALRLTPGEHTLTWCWVSMNALGTGGGKCGLTASGVKFQPGQRYVVDFSNANEIKGPPGGEMMLIHIKSEIRNLDTGEVVFSRQGGAEGSISQSVK